MGGASQGFSAPEAAGPPALADPQPWAGRQLVPRGPFSILLCQRRRNSQPCRQPSVHRGEQTKRGPHTTEQYSASKRKEVPTRLPQHGRSFTIMLRLKEARHKTAEAIQFRFQEAPPWALSERQKVGGGGQGSGERKGGFVFNADRVSTRKEGGALEVTVLTLRNMNALNATGLYA